MRIAPSKILVTGGNGFIGGSLAKELLKAGHIVHVFDMQSEPSSTVVSLGIPAMRGFSYLQGDVSDSSAFDRLGEDYTHIVHAAAVLGIRRVCEESVLTLRTNIVGTENCLRFAARQRRLERFLMLSTSEIYGPKAGNCCETDQAVIPSQGERWCYATSKIAGEQLTTAYGKEFGVPYVIVRPFNVYGSDRRGPNALSTFVHKALMGETIILSGDGQQTRAWCHIDDFVDGLLRCLFKPEARNQIFNLGNPRETVSMADLARQICEVIGVSIPVRLSESTEPDVLARSPDITKAEHLLDFRPQISLRAGVERFVAEVEASKEKQQAA